MARVTNQEIYKRQVQHEKDDRREFRSIKNTLQEIVPKVSDMHDYIVEQKGIDKYKLSNRGAGFSISPDIIKLLLILAGIIAALVGWKVSQ